MNPEWIADVVFIAEEAGKIIGFATAKINSEEESQGILFGTAPEARGKGVYTAFVKETINWSLSKNKKRQIMGTQVNNHIVQNVWTRLGFKLKESFYTLHWWSDSEGDEEKKDVH